MTFKILRKIRRVRRGRERMRMINGEKMQFYSTRRSRNSNVAATASRERRNSIIAIAEASFIITFSLQKKRRKI